ncbi:sugar kinase [Streptomyces sodiiphilus]|uniref:Sugar kinase n=1 Tax=Streptomyces sodiiphilus TaxID=226217 RepID=A0ABN2NXB5_9ACTN
MPEVVCLGEALYVLTAEGGTAALGDATAFRPGAGGAEANVACALAALGHPVRWVSRLGTDDLGDRLLALISRHGVDVSRVTRDPRRPTGLYLRTAGRPADGSGQRTAPRTAYYRAGSAASAMSPGTVDATAWAGARVLHLTGITAALSDGCLALLRRLTAPAPGRPLVSFDVNFRPALWRDRDPGVLLDLARRCDLVFVGEDEAASAWGTTGGPRAVRALLPEPAALVVKQDAAGATAFTAAGVEHRPAPAVEVTDPTGAGDAFAAGYLSALLRGLPVAARLRHGHLQAAAALTSPGDLARRPAPWALADGLCALGDDDWAALRLAPGWTTGGVPAPARPADGEPS